MYRNLGLDLPGCAKLLHVTERTLHNWQSGKHDIPFAAYKLLRLLNRMDLPGPSWAGWCFHGGKLWSPEGHSFTGTDSSWWSLLIRQARLFPVVNARVTQLEIKLKTAGATGSAGGSAGAAAHATALPVAAADAANQPNYAMAPMVITGITHGVSYRGMSRRAA